ncbi:MAG: hypothetical protein PVJ30_02835 [Thiohalocapsa sp.]|nr:hypothetical protein [Thiohalocapsa sp.]
MFDLLLMRQPGPQNGCTLAQCLPLLVVALGLLLLLLLLLLLS